MSGPPTTPDDPGPAAPALAPGLESTIYAHLRAIAQNQMNNERPGHTLSATALVHEAYLRLANASDVVPAGRVGFLHAAAEAMRRILIEHARARGRIKRGGGLAKVSLDAIGDVADLAQDGPGDHIIAFDEAFRRLEEHDPRRAEVIRLRFFAGLSVADTAAALSVSDRTVNNDWAYARAWLAREMQRADAQ